MALGHHPHISIYKRPKNTLVALGGPLVDALAEIGDHLSGAGGLEDGAAGHNDVGAGLGGGGNGLGVEAAVDLDVLGGVKAAELLDLERR